MLLKLTQRACQQLLAHTAVRGQLNQLLLKQSLSTSSFVSAKLERTQAPKTQTTYKKPFSYRKQFLFGTYDTQIASSPSVVVVQHHNLSGSELMAHRRDLKTKAQGARLMIVRPKMIKAVLRDTRYTNLADLFSGPTAIIYWTEKVDTIVAMRQAMDVVKKQRKIILMGAKFEDMLLNVPMMNNLVDLPSLDILRAQVVGIIQSPAQQLAAVLNRIPQRLVGVLKQKAEAKESSE
ncbi:hypothetical protein J3B02_003307 [Coemansia erecta]|uniref:Ribosomal protein L10 n=1 Tax=Coemansia asiatica TaxID=1052880 RepID=A0A9W8CK95_9FUNG|nr:hypothetical protein LPJ64_001143 [Coemansia asiatica]KAJ2853054.1 hypothetical protein J3B02_003307 [Coemansia erecta]KAJ2880343.1 hypothetical protein FB639_002856 [Coemansia asiatica]